MSNSRSRQVEDADTAGGYLDELPDGCGCTEVWEHLSDARRQAADD